MDIPDLSLETIYKPNQPIVQLVYPRLQDQGELHSSGLACDTHREGHCLSSAISGKCRACENFGQTHHLPAIAE